MEAMFGRLGSLGRTREDESRTRLGSKRVFLTIFSDTQLSHTQKEKNNASKPHHKLRLLSPNLLHKGRTRVRLSANLTRLSHAEITFALRTTNDE